MLELEHKIALEFGFKYCLLFGKARTGLFFAAKAMLQDKSILIPDIICETAVYPFVYHCKKIQLQGPVEDGFNADYLNNQINTDSVLLTNLYGVPFKEDYLQKVRSKFSFVIEDLAEGVIPYGYKTSSDIVCTSFGPGKIIDFGVGGALFFNKKEIYSQVKKERDSWGFEKDASNAQPIFMKKIYEFMKENGVQPSPTEKFELVKKLPELSVYPLEDLAPIKKDFDKIKSNLQVRNLIQKKLLQGLGLSTAIDCPLWKIPLKVKPTDKSALIDHLKSAAISFDTFFIPIHKLMPLRVENPENSILYEDHIVNIEIPNTLLGLDIILPKLAPIKKDIALYNGGENN